MRSEIGLQFRGHLGQSRRAKLKFRLQRNRIHCFARRGARREIEDGSLVALPLGRRKLQRRWGILHWRGKRLNLAEETFIGLCESASMRFT